MGAGVSARRRPRTPDAAERRALRRGHLLAAAFELFADRGYWETSVEQICHAAHVSTKSFYELFPNKESCFMQVLRGAARRIAAQLGPTRHTATTTESDTIAALVESFVHALVSDPRLMRLLLTRSGEVSALDERYSRGLRHRTASMIESIWSRFEIIGGRPRPSPTPVPRPDPHAVALALVGGVNDLVIDWAHHGGVPDHDDVDGLVVAIHLWYDVVRGGLHTRPGTLTARSLGG